MSVQTTIEIPELVHERLREQAERAGTSAEALIMQAVEQRYVPTEEPKKGRFVTEGMIKAGGKRGPLYPTDKTPWDLILP